MPCRCKILEITIEFISETYSTFFKYKKPGNKVSLETKMNFNNMLNKSKLQGLITSSKSNNYQRLRVKTTTPRTSNKL